MATIHDFSGVRDNGRGTTPPEPPDMDARLRAIEDRLLEMEVRADQFATKTDLAELKHSLVLWLLSLGAAAVVATVGALAALLKVAGVLP